jgi:predicted membrane protein
MAEKPKRADSRIIIGFIFILAGAYLLLYNLNLLPFILPDYVLSWKTLLIAIGLLLLGTRENKGGGVTLIIVGSTFLIADVLDITIGQLIREVWLFWPAIFIIIGVALLLRHRREKKSEDYSETTGYTASEEAYFEATAIFSSSDRASFSQNFRGAKLTAVFGGVDIDLTEARLAPGTHEIDVFTMLGGVDIILPNDWNVRQEITPVLGGYEDKRKYARHYTPGTESTLVIRGVVFLGGVEVKSP